MTTAVRLWALAITAVCAVTAALVSLVEFTERSCPFGFCSYEQFRDLRYRAAVVRQIETITHVKYRAASDLALASRVLPAAIAGEPAIWFAPDVPDVARRSVRAALDAERRARAPWLGHGTVGVVVLVDSASRFDGRKVPRGGWPVATRALYPSPATGGRCVAVIRLRGTALHESVTGSVERPLLDACGLVDAFGPPGAAIAAALDSGAYRAARLYIPAARDSVRRRADRLALLWYNDDLSVHLCAAGAATECENRVLRTMARRSSYAFGIAPASLPTTDEWDPANGPALMDAIAADLGPERFARFWTSDLPASEAYHAVAGRPLGGLARSVIQADLGRQHVHRAFGFRATRVLSATIGSSALVLLTIAGLVALASRVSRRPTMA